MLYNKLGLSNIYLSEVGFGCMSLNVKDQSDSKYLIDKAIDGGINYFDTADLYDFGENEKLLGTAVKQKREKVIIATKVGNKWNADKSAWTWDVSKEYINTTVNDSLARLQTDYIDLYQIHGGTIDDNFEEVVETLENLITSGKIRSYGISSIRPNVFLRFANDSNIVSNMMQFSLLDTRPEAYLDTLNKANISILARGGFAQGLLFGKPVREYLDHSIAQVQYISSRVTQLSNQLGVLPESIALAYLLRYKHVTTTVVGIRADQHLDKVLKAVDQLRNLEIDFNSLEIPKITYQSHIK